MAARGTRRTCTSALPSSQNADQFWPRLVTGRHRPRTDRPAGTPGTSTTACWPPDTSCCAAAGLPCRRRNSGICRPHT
eukprot:2073957-Pyramimonas_sp.AAC.1